MTEIAFIYTVFPDEDVAAETARAALEKKLAACANILPVMRSLYLWKGKIEDEAEVAVIFKTTDDRYDALEKLIRKHHPYEVPCIVALPIENGHAPYLQWVVDQTS